MKVHLERDGWVYTPCGFPQWSVERSDKPEEVTCKVCVKYLRRQAGEV